MILVGTDPIYGTMYNRNDHKPVITVPGQNVSVKSGTAQIADEQNGGYLVGKTNYIFSVVTMHPSENPDFILYVTVQQPEHFSNPWFGEFANPILERASAMKESLNLSLQQKIWIKLQQQLVIQCQRPRTIVREIWQRNCDVILFNQLLSDQEQKLKKVQYQKELISMLMNKFYYSLIR